MNNTNAMTKGKCCV